MPWRLRIPLAGREVEPGRGGQKRSRERETGRSLHFLGERASEIVCDVHVAALEHGQTRGVVGDAAEYQALDGGHLTPEPLMCLEDEFDTRREGHESVGAGTDGRLLETFLPDPQHVAPRGDPGRARRRRPDERHEVGPGFLEADTHAIPVDDLDGGNLLLQELRRRPAIALEGELYVLRGHEVSVVEPDRLFATGTRSSGRPAQRSTTRQVLAPSDALASA